jgi:uncharacterized protein (DUF1499 family)
MFGLPFDVIGPAGNILTDVIGDVFGASAKHKEFISEKEKYLKVRATDIAFAKYCDDLNFKMDGNKPKEWMKLYNDYKSKQSNKELEQEQVGINERKESLKNNSNVYLVMLGLIAMILLKK